jgi:hypothetical protein
MTHHTKVGIALEGRFGYITVCITVAAIGISLYLAKEDGPLSLLPAAVIFGWTQIGGL